MLLGAGWRNAFLQFEYKLALKSHVWLGIEQRRLHGWVGKKNPREGSECAELLSAGRGCPRARPPALGSRVCEEGSLVVEDGSLGLHGWWRVLQPAASAVAGWRPRAAPGAKCNCGTSGWGTQLHPPFPGWPRGVEVGKQRPRKGRSCLHGILRGYFLFPSSLPSSCPKFIFSQVS